jgi:hypothetical protein
MSQLDTALPRRKAPVAALVVVWAVALYGCGSSHQSRVAQLTFDSRPAIKLWSPGLLRQKLIPSRYKCGQNVWLPLRWGPLPGGAAELVLLVTSFGNKRHVPQGGTDSELVAVYSIIGLRPVPKVLTVGNIPRQSTVISIRSMPACPTDASHPEYTFRIFALGARHRINNRTLESTTPTAFVHELERDAVAIGRFSAEPAANASSAD